MTNPPDYQAWATQWNKTGKALQKIHEEELQSFNYQENLPILNSMLNYACQHATPRLTSGLVEMRQYFNQIVIPAKAENP